MTPASGTPDAVRHHDHDDHQRGPVRMVNLPPRPARRQLEVVMRLISTLHAELGPRSRARSTS